MPCFCLFAIAALTLCAMGAGADRLINSFETEEEMREVLANNVALAPVTEAPTQGKRALQVTYNVGKWPNVMLRPGNPWDWRGFDGVAFDLRNPGSETVDFGVRVDDDPRADGAVHCRQGGGSLRPGEQATFVLSLRQDPMEFGMRGIPRAGRDYVLLTPHNSGPIKLEHIVAFQVFLAEPRKPTPLVLDNVRLVNWSASLDGIVDRFGQYTGAEWPGKVKSEAELADRLRREEAALKSAPSLPDRDKWGGWASGPKVRATGWFRTEQVNGKWWLVTPDGTLFISLGVDCVNMGDATLTGGRERMFTWLPKKGEPLSSHIGYVQGVHMGPIKEGATYTFSAANIERKYGPDYKERWNALILRRLKAWGFNTIGNWSSWDFHNNGQVPYVATAHVAGDHARVSSGSDYWGKMHDVFDPKFSESVAASLRPVAQRVRQDPWCIGYFVDNELSWAGGGEEGGRYGLALGALASDSSAPAKQALLRQLRAKYGEIAALNAAWSTTFANWGALEAGWAPPTPLGARVKEDLAAFAKAFARRYFTTVRDELRKLDPNHLYLGCRFAWRTPDAEEASAEICDVVSYNFYVRSLDKAQYAFLNNLKKPVIIGEFHAGALDRGMFHTGLVATRDQADRASMYQEYVRSVLDHPALVGCHWFQLMDQPITGRWFDGENYNIGFLDVTDTPYPELLAAAKTVHREAYRRRAGR